MRHWAASGLQHCLHIPHVTFKCWKVITLPFTCFLTVLFYKMWPEHDFIAIFLIDWVCAGKDGVSQCGACWAPAAALYFTSRWQTDWTAEGVRLQAICWSELLVQTENKTRLRRLCVCVCWSAVMYHSCHRTDTHGGTLQDFLSQHTLHNSKYKSREATLWRKHSPVTFQTLLTQKTLSDTNWKHLPDLWRQIRHTNPPRTSK